MISFAKMKLNLDTSLVEFSQKSIAGLSASMSTKLAKAVASYAGRSESADATVLDLLSYYPMRYEDRSRLLAVDQIEEGTDAAVELYVRVAGGYRVGKKRPRGSPPLFIFEITASDRDRTTKPVVVWWFVSGKKALPIIDYWRSKFANGTRFIAYGKWEWDNRRNTFALNLKKPDELEILGQADEPDADDEPKAPGFSAVHVARRVPVYRKLGDFQSKRLREIFFDTIENLSMEGLSDDLPARIVDRQHLIPLAEALREIHFPPEESELKKYAAARSEAHRRLIFEEFFWLSFALRYRRGKLAETPKGAQFEISESLRGKCIDLVPFELTGAQKRVLEEVFEDMSDDSPMNRLVHRISRGLCCGVEWLSGRDHGADRNPCGTALSKCKASVCGGRPFTGFVDRKQKGI